MNKHEKEYKQFLEYGRRIRQLEKKIAEQPTVRLKEPYQRGWEVYLDFRDDIKNRKDYPELKEVLNLTDKPFETRDINLIRYIRSHRSLSGFHYGRDRYRTYDFEFRRMFKGEYHNLPVDIRKHFIQLSDKYGKEYWYPKIPDYWFIVKTRPNIITHTKDIGGRLYKELAYLEDKRSQLGTKFWINYSSSYPAYKDRAITRDKVSKFLKGEIEDITTEKIPKEYDY